jgi:hypothetical protein
MLVTIPNVLSAYCDDSGRTKVTHCTSHTSNCGNYYEFNFDPNTGKYSNLPKICSSNGISCVAGATCEPACSLLKTGGPDSLVCSQFFDKVWCATFYADNYGDKWCYWDCIGSSCVCLEGLTCHD